MPSPSVHLPPTPTRPIGKPNGTNHIAQSDGQLAAPSYTKAGGGGPPPALRNGDAGQPIASSSVSPKQQSIVAMAKTQAVSDASHSNSFLSPSYVATVTSPMDPKVKSSAIDDGQYQPAAQPTIAASTSASPGPSSLQPRAPPSPPIPMQAAFLSHPRVFNSPSPPPTGSGPGQVPLELLTSELAHEDDQPIPLAAIVERVTSEAYETLQNLGETMSSLPSSTRRTRIFNAALDLRRQMIKLYVLVQWSRGARHLQHLKDVIGLIHEQSYHTVDAREHLAETRAILPNARSRNHDLVTAIDVLSAGLPMSTIPEAVKEEGGQSYAPLTDAEVRTIVEELDQAIRVRLAYSETLPGPLQSDRYEVADGRVKLNATDLFTVTLTLSGDKDEDDRWFLLSVNFDYEITGTGKERFPQDLWESQREGFIASANDVLAPRPATEEETVDAPIVRLYDFLQSQALEYQLDILAYQLAELSRITWREHVSWSWQERCLVVKYWTQNNSASQQKTRWNPLQGGTIRLQVKEVIGSSKSAKAKLSRDLSAKKKQSQSSEEAHLQLSLQWEATELSGLDGPVEAVIDAQDLDFEKILQDVTARHSRLAVAALRERIIKGSVGSLASIAKTIIVEDETEAKMTVELHETCQVNLNLDARTGHISLTPAVATSSASPLVGTSLSDSSVTYRLKEATRVVNAAPDRLGEVLCRLRTHAIRDDLERKALYLGITSMRRLNLPQEDFTRLARGKGQQGSSYLFLPLQQRSGLYDVFVISEDGRVEVAVICALPMASFNADGSTSAGQQDSIQRLDWLDAETIVGPAVSKKRKRSLYRQPAGRDDSNRPVAKAITMQGLARLYTYSIAFSLSTQVETQLKLRGIRFAHAMDPDLSAGVGADSTEANDLVPSLLIPSTDLFGPSAASLLTKNVLVRIRDCSDPDRCTLKLIARLKHSGGQTAMSQEISGPLRDPRVIRNSQDPSLLVFSTRNILQAVDLFQYEFHSVAKIASLANTLLSKSTPGLNGYKLVSNDLESTVIAYEDSLRCHVRWNRGDTSALSNAASSGYRLQFSSEQQEDKDEADNPHALVSQHLEQLLTALGPTALPNWPAFLQLLDDLLPVLRVLNPLVKQQQNVEEDRMDDDEALKPDVEVLSSSQYIVHFLEKYRLSIRLVKGGRFLLEDGKAAKGKEEDVPAAEEEEAIPNLANTFEKVVVEGGADKQSHEMQIGATLLCETRGGTTSARRFEEVLRGVIEEISKRTREAEGLTASE